MEDKTNSKLANKRHVEDGGEAAVGRFYKFPKNESEAEEISNKVDEEGYVYMEAK